VYAAACPRLTCTITNQHPLHERQERPTTTEQAAAAHAAAGRPDILSSAAADAASKHLSGTHTTHPRSASLPQLVTMVTSVSGTGYMWWRANCESAAAAAKRHSSLCSSCQCALQQALQMC
jgi:hypothetical protein